MERCCLVERPGEAYVSAAGRRPTPRSQDAALTSAELQKRPFPSRIPARKPGNPLSLLVCSCRRGRSAASSPDGGEQGGEGRD